MRTGCLVCVYVQGVQSVCSSGCVHQGVRGESVHPGVLVARQGGPAQSAEGLEAESWGLGPVFTGSQLQVSG